MTAVTAEGATAATEHTVEARSPALWLSGGAGFGMTCRLLDNPGISDNTGRGRALKAFAGRSKPVVVTSESLSRVVQVAGEVGDLDGDVATSNELRALAQNPSDLYLWRTPAGERVYGMVPGIALTWLYSLGHEDGFNSVWAYQFTLTEGTDA